MAMSKTAAIREASAYVAIVGSGTSWEVYGPYRLSDLTGPTTSVGWDSYQKARLCRTKWRAEIALSLMGRLDDETRFGAEAEASDPYGDHTVRGMVDGAIKRAEDALLRAARRKLDWAAIGK